jgi:hypothetical protein
MAVELQVRAQTFALVIARALQRAQMTACAPPSQGFYVDHVDSVPEQARWSSESAGAVTLRLPLDAFVVRRDELLAAPDQVAPGATTPAGQVELVIRVAIDGTQLIVSVEDVDLGAAGILAASEKPLSLDLGPLLKSLAIDPAKSAGEVVLVDDLVVVRLGSLAGPPAAMRTGFEWAFFFDGATVEGLLRARMPKSIPELQSVATGVHWQPIGITPAVQAFVQGPFKVPDPFTCLVTLSLDCRFSLERPAPDIRIDVTTSVDVDTGLIPADQVLSGGLSNLIEAMIDPAKFGGLRTGPHSFAMTLPLPQIGLGTDGVWHYDLLFAGEAGLMVGGTVDLPVDLSHVRLTTETDRFSGGNVAMLYCSHDDPVTDVPFARFFKTVAVVDYRDGGALCDVEVASGGTGLEAHLTLPKELTLSDHRPGNGKIFMAFGPEDANQVTGPVLLIVRTPRGVRCCNLGQPDHFVINEDGTIANGIVLYTDDCNKLPPNFGDMTPEEYERWIGTIWYTYWGLVPGKDYDPDKPPILPDTLAEIPPDWDEVAVVPSATETDPGGTELVVVVPTDFKVTPVETEIDTV